MKPKTEKSLKSLSIVFLQILNIMLFSIVFIWVLAASVFSIAFLSEYVEIPALTTFTGLMILGSVLAIYTSVALLLVVGQTPDCYDKYLQDKGKTDDYLNYRRSWIRGEK